MYPKRFGSELAVIARAKDLADYVFEATRKSPKVFRFLLSRACRILCSTWLNSSTGQTKSS